MAKRFIDTGLFDDPWFMDLSKDAKIFWVYCITKCDHAGIIELNERLFKFQTGLKSMETVIKELDNRLVRVNEQYYFIPKFLDFQYPNFPNSKVRAQRSAIEILKKLKINLNPYLTVSKELGKDYGYVYGHDHGNGYDYVKVRSAFIKNVKENCDELGYNEEMMNEFCEYWTERDFESGKMQFQTKENFGIKSRLKNWKKLSQSGNENWKDELKNFKL